MIAYLKVSIIKFEKSDDNSSIEISLNRSPSYHCRLAFMTTALILYYYYLPFVFDTAAAII